MHGWIGDITAALVAVTDLAVAIEYAAHLNKQEKEIWPT